MKGEMVPDTGTIRLYTVSSRPVGVLAGSVTIRWGDLSREPVPWGGKVRLPQRPEVSSKQATPLPLPNGLRQPPNLPQSAFIRAFYPRISA